MRSARLAAAVVLVAVLAACTTVTRENFERIRDGMNESEVFSILGKPDESANVTLLRVKAVNSKWIGGDYTITVQFVNGRVRAKTIGPRP